LGRGGRRVVAGAGEGEPSVVPITPFIDSGPTLPAPVYERQLTGPVIHTRNRRRDLVVASIAVRLLFTGLGARIGHELASCPNLPPPPPPAEPPVGHGAALSFSFFPAFCGSGEAFTGALFLDPQRTARASPADGRHPRRREDRGRRDVRRRRGSLPPQEVWTRAPRVGERQPDAEPVHAAPSTARLVPLDDEVPVVLLDRKVNHAKSRQPQLSPSCRLDSAHVPLSARTSSG
jgi:hypothetical protein